MDRYKSWAYFYEDGKSRRAASSLLLHFFSCFISSHHLKQKIKLCPSSEPFRDMTTWEMYITHARPASIAVILQIFSIILISTFACVDGLQDAPSSTHVWSVSWLRGVKADDAKLQTHQGVLKIAQLPGVHPNVLEGAEDGTWDCPYSRQCKCRYSAHDNFAYLFQLICLPRYPTSQANLKNASADKISNGAESKEIAQSLSSPSCSDAEANCANTSTQLLLSPSYHEEARASEQHISTDALPEGNAVNLTDAAKNASQIPTSKLSNIIVRQEPGGGPYNYASEVKGAKILASNKEAKGASNILNGDKDKYLHIPCSTPNKHVILELSEETLVVTIAIANHEFYSSNLRVFELWGSSVYPTDNWTNSGRFEAENVRTLQTFQLNDPQWVRYLKLVMVSHYGSDFYCTISVLEVHGVDAIERLLEDWIAEDRSTKGTLTGSSPQEERKLKNEPNIALSNSASPREAVASATSMSIQVNTSKDCLAENLKGSSDTKGGSDLKEVSKVDTLQVAHHQASRPAPDAVLKLLMQKVRSLEQSQPSLFQSIHELIEQSKRAQEGHDKDLAQITTSLNAKVSEFEELKAHLHRMERRWMHEKLVLEKAFHSQVTTWDRNMELFRTRIKDMENKEMVAIAIALLATLTIITLQIIIFCVSLLKTSKQKNRRVSNHGTCRKIAWFVPLVSCFLVVFVLSL
ncbi:hypothetical protein GOP47_0030093 [Adiantum capillus-veneris]|nr:hypothetical protein GOP47_0030093 [Adiantum capillus-veneris]